MKRLIGPCQSAVPCGVCGRCDALADALMLAPYVPDVPHDVLANYLQTGQVPDDIADKREAIQSAEGLLWSSKSVQEDRGK